MHFLRLPISCSVQANEGSLYLLDDGLFFLKRPVLFLSKDDIEEISCARVGSSYSSGRTFDLDVRKADGNVQSFSMIKREDEFTVSAFLSDLKAQHDSQTDGAPNSTTRTFDAETRDAEHLTTTDLLNAANSEEDSDWSEGSNLNAQSSSDDDDGEYRDEEQYGNKNEYEDDDEDKAFYVKSEERLRSSATNRPKRSRKGKVKEKSNARASSPIDLSSPVETPRPANIAAAIEISSEGSHTGTATSDNEEQKENSSHSINAIDTMHEEAPHSTAQKAVPLSKKRRNEPPTASDAQPSKKSQAKKPAAPKAATNKQKSRSNPKHRSDSASSSDENTLLRYFVAVSKP